MRAARTISAALFLWTTFLAPSVSGGFTLNDPIMSECKARPSQWAFEGRKYFSSVHPGGFNADESTTPPEEGLMEWLDARNVCRRRCMELISIETEAEFQMLKALMIRKKVKGFWTSGRLCDYHGCLFQSPEPVKINGWFWSGIQERIPPANIVPKSWTKNPWSPTGHAGGPQPDDVEFHLGGEHESCLAVLNNAYRDGVAWHDRSCTRKLAFICEDNDFLLQWAEKVEYQILKSYRQ